MKKGTPGPAEGWRILVVDDDEAILRLAEASIKHALGKEHRVALVLNGEEAITEARRERPDLVLLDIMLPGLDGFEVCRQLRDDPSTKGIPIIFLTARGEQDYIERGLALGGDGYVIKPFDAATLAAQIAELLTPEEKQAH
jgi:DNA-binding response OmpR family regulator